MGVVVFGDDAATLVVVLVWGMQSMVVVVVKCGAPSGIKL